MIAVVTHYEIAVFRHLIGSEVSSGNFSHETVIQGSFGIIDIDFTVYDLNFFPGKPDDTFDKQLAFIIRILKDNDIKSLMIFELFIDLMSEKIYIQAISKPVTEDAVSGHNGILHRL